MINVAAFYKYTNLENPQEFASQHQAWCREIGLRGRILVASEGINGTVSGTSEQIEQYKQALQDDARFEGIEFKEDECLMHPFNRMIVKVKPELVRFEQEVDLADVGTHLSPEEFLTMAQEEDVIVLDARNDYESRVGKFKNAFTPSIKTFREFPRVASELRDKKDKKILMYCTGGIRCEKASAFMKKEGFSHVYQLHGGILNFAKHCPNTLWEGKCFVFDKRLISDVNSDNKPITHCDICATPCDLYKNCRNNACDAFTVTCLECERSYGGCCSKECFTIINQQAP